MQNFQGIIFILIRTYEEIFKSAFAICKSRNGESGNGMRGMIGTRGIRAGTRGIRVGTRGIKVGMRGIRVGMQGIRLILCENLRVSCFG